MRRIVHFLGVASLLLVMACGTEPGPTEVGPDADPSFGRRAAGAAGGGAELGTVVNAGAAERGYALAKMEYFTDPSSGHMGRTVVFSDRGNKQLGSDWIPGDPRRAWGDIGGTGITYLIDEVDGAATPGLSPAATTAAIERAMDTWSGVTCSEIGLMGGPFPIPVDLGLVQFLLGFGGIDAVVADLTHAGWLPRGFFDTVVPPDPPDPPGGDFILGATFTFVWVDGNGDPTDVNNDGKADVAFREIYYNDEFDWADGSTFDVETVALHEAGHGLSQAHFGAAFVTGKNGKVHFAPRAVMNAAYSGVQTEITATDNGGHCSIWSDWPND